MPIDWSRAKYSPSAQAWLLYLSAEELRALRGEPPAGEDRLSALFPPRRVRAGEKYRLPLELVIAGGPERCGSEHFPYAEKVVLDIADLAQKAEEYLKAFIDPARINDSSGDVCVQALEFGTGEDAEAGQFTMGMTLNKDTYGHWTVRFRYSGDASFVGFIPEHFSRRQD